MRAFFIYALCEPGTRTIRYIGASTNPTRRISTHLCTAKEGLSSPLWDWLRNLSKKPTLIVLWETSETEWQEDERLFISNARMLGMALVNSTDGGEGIKNPIPSLRAKLRAAHLGIPLSPETRAAMSAAHQGLSRSPEHRAAIGAGMKGMTKSPKHRAALSAALKGVPKSPEQCAALSGTLKKLWANPEYRAKMIAARNKNS